MQSCVMELEPRSGICTNCGIPLDSEYFDESGVMDVPPPGNQIVLASIQLRPQYCGVLEYFSQYTDQYGKDPSQIATRGLEWSILSNGHPLYPYIRLEHIVNPWGFGSFQTNIRLAEGTTLEFVVRQREQGQAQPGPIAKVGGRLVGRYWYNTAYGSTAGKHGR